MGWVLEKELKQPGDATTILEERDRFSVFRLRSLTESQWSVLAIQVGKRDFDGSFEDVRKRVTRERLN